MLNKFTQLWKFHIIQPFNLLHLLYRLLRSRREMEMS